MLSSTCLLQPSEPCWSRRSAATTPLHWPRQNRTGSQMNRTDGKMKGFINGQAEISHLTQTLPWNECELPCSQIWHLLSCWIKWACDFFFSFWLLCSANWFIPMLIAVWTQRTIYEGRNCFIVNIVNCKWKIIVHNHNCFVKDHFFHSFNCCQLSVEVEKDWIGDWEYVCYITLMIKICNKTAEWGLVRFVVVL